MSESSPPSKWRSLYPAPIQSALIAVTGACLIHEVFVHILPEELTHAGIWFLAACGAYLLERAFHISYEGKAKFKKFMEEFHSSMGLAAPIVESLNDISSLPYSRALERHFVDQNLPRQVNALFAEWQKRIVLRHKWRLIFERHLNSEVAAITGNSLSLPLNTYLQILLEFISVSMEEARDSERRLVIRSFTNARPKDWFAKIGAPSAAESMDAYRTKLQQLVEQLRAGHHIYHRHVLCSSSLTGYGFSDARTVENGWLQLTEDERRRYYSVHSEGKEGAFYVDLDEDVAFRENHTEYIYFGFKKGTELSWEWCFCCLFTNNNLNVSASFIDMSSPVDSEKLVIDAPNSKNRNLKKEFAIPPKLQVSFQEFPSAIDEDSLGRTKPFRSVARLAFKWHRASLIWHDNKEEQVLSDYFGANLPAGASILDCACGTGFHALLLAKLGFAVTASDIDSDNIAILKGRPEYQAKSFPAHVAEWRDLGVKVGGKFDCVLCLGSSITYYDSWQEDTDVKTYKQTDLQAILQEMKRMLKPNGKLIVGICRHYDRRLKSFDCAFADHHIQGINHSMKWGLTYDWNKRHKTWLCEIWNENKEDYSFKLSSYLFDAQDLKEICAQEFGNQNTSIVDVDSSYYDTLVISQNT